MRIGFERECGGEVDMCLWLWLELEHSMMERRSKVFTRCDIDPPKAF